MEQLRQKAYTSFTEHLMTQAIRPGQFVSQRELVELTGMPLGAIRELVPRLEAEGLITTIPKRGMQIAPIDIQLVRDAYEFRLIVEKEAVAQFATLASDNLVAETMRRHEDIRNEARSNPVAADLEDRAQAVDWGFHDLIVDHMANRITSNAYRVNSLKIRLIRRELTRIQGLVRPVMEEHLRILEGVQSREPAAAVAALERHIRTARDRALGLGD
ncbi:MAG: GntR family transcriptional regulator [Hyphomicrobiales bacterium]|nr:GntR family transcriptional regulator [Hyphomicrobiales bacterium]